MAENLSSYFKSKLFELRQNYSFNPLFPHLVLEQALDPEIAESAAREFPNHTEVRWQSYTHYNEKKLALNDFFQFPNALKNIVEELNSPEFVSLLGQITGMPNLLSDPDLAGGGLHMTNPGGFLNLHRDFTAHPRMKTWQRRLNLILYLNPEWDRKWGGEIEFWDSSVKECVLKVSPRLNTLVLFDIFSGHYHGYPSPIMCPPGKSRKSIALYYYVNEAKNHVIERSTQYHAMPSDPLLKHRLIRAENSVLRLYSFLRRRFHFSDKVATRILQFKGSWPE